MIEIIEKIRIDKYNYQLFLKELNWISRSCASLGSDLGSRGWASRIASESVNAWIVNEMQADAPMSIDWVPSAILFSSVIDRMKHETSKSRFSVTA